MEKQAAVLVYCGLMLLSAVGSGGRLYDVLYLVAGTVVSQVYRLGRSPAKF
jgi:hypothetical protein